MLFGTAVTSSDGDDDADFAGWVRRRPASWWQVIFPIFHFRQRHHAFTSPLASYLIWSL